jgi:multimeric flavodoxin WrbA
MTMEELLERGRSMYVIGISGSPRKDGNTAILVNEVLKHIIGKKKFISLAGLNINPCDSCDRCWKENMECVIDDDIKWILKELEKCDAMILGSPCYFGTVNAQLKMLIDRSLSIRYPDEKDKLRNKIGGVVVTQDVQGSGGKLVLLTIEQFYSPEIIYAGGVIGEGGAEIGHIKKDRLAMKGAEELAARIMELHEIMNAG